MSILAEKCKNMAIKIQEPTLYLRVDKKKKDGKMPICIRFQRIDKKEPKFSLGINCSPEQWDEVGQRILNSDGLDIILQEEVNRIKKEVRNAEVNGVEITKELLKEIVSGKQKKYNQSENQSFYYYFEEYISKKREIGKIQESTWNTYQPTLRSLKEFRQEIRIIDISKKLLDDFDKYLIKRGTKNHKGTVEGSRRNRIKHIRAVIRYIEDLRIPIKNPYKTLDLAIPNDKENNIFLEIDELRRMFCLINKVKEKSIEYRVLLMYLFSCVTGIRIGDALAVKWGDLDVERSPIILSFVAIKTKKCVSVPIFPLAEEVLMYAPEGNIDNVERNKKIFHTYPQELINKTLRELAKKANIDKHITFHSSRRTFATLAIIQGIPLNDLKNYMGHSSAKTTERYTKWSSSLAEYSAQKVDLFQVKELLTSKKRTPRKNKP